MSNLLQAQARATGGNPAPIDLNPVELHNEGSLEDIGAETLKAIYQKHCPGTKLVTSWAPTPVHTFKNRATEFQHVVYMPIKTPGRYYVDRLQVPDNLHWALPLADKALASLLDPDGYESYVYLTVKHGWVEKGQAGNREGWHIDGWGSDGDENYIWCDRVPTEYLVVPGIELPLDHAKCLERLRDLENYHHVRTLEPLKLYRLGSSIHRCGIAKESGMRTFVKVSISKHKYDLLGNARNPLLPETHWPLKPREATRNHPTSGPA